MSERRHKALAASELASDFLGDALWASWTAEQWAEHEARVAAATAKDLAAERERRADDERRELVRCGLPLDKLRSIAAGESHDTDALAAVRKFLASESRLLVLAGGRGVGKTYAATWWATREQPPPVELACGPPRFVDAPALARWPRYDDERMTQLEGARALVIDDLGLEYNDRHGAFTSLLDGLVNHRYAALLPTVITTNQGAAAFCKRYGERVADRIREVGRFVELHGPSLRARLGSASVRQGASSREGGRL